MASGILEHAAGLLNVVAAVVVTNLLVSSRSCAELCSKSAVDGAPL
jgi:hypothetical protein